MEKSTEKSQFSFDGYSIIRSVVTQNVDIKPGSDISIGFRPEGVIYKDSSKFDLTIEFNASDENGSFSIDVTSLAHFSFNNVVINTKEDLSPLFLLNAPAILFPYIRAFVSTLTTLSGIKPVLLPTLNLSGMSNVLRENIQIVE